MTQNRSAIERYGLAVIVFIVVWIALGLYIALIGAVLVIAFELILRGLSPTYGREPTDGSTKEPPASAAPTPTPVLEPLVPEDESTAGASSADAPTTKTPAPKRSSKKPPAG